MRRTTAALAVLGLSLTALVACTNSHAASDVLHAFLAGWPTGKLDGVGFLDASGLPVSAKTVVSEIDELSGDLDPATMKLTAVGDPAIANGLATAPVDVDWTVHGQVWHYRTKVLLKGGDDSWRVVWSADTVNPQLHPGNSLTLSILRANRGSILGQLGVPLIDDRKVVTVGLQPREITDQKALLATLQSAFDSVHLGITLDDVPAALAKAKPDAFVEVVTLRWETYVAIRSKIKYLDGVYFHEGTRQLAPTRTFGRALLGSVGDVRADQMQANPGIFAVGDQVGQGGLEEQYDQLLRGHDGVEVAITGRDTAEAAVPDLPIFTVKPTPGTSLAMTIDPATQTAAEGALVGQAHNAAVVAVRVSDGAILAVANGPNGGTNDLALNASVPPGSTFKMITSLAVLNGGLTADSTVACPKTFSVEGRAFTNEHGFALGAVPLRTDFAKSCNTAFASLYPQLGATGLREAAASVGVGTAWNLGTEVFTGSVQANPAPVDSAAAAFGQGKTLVSPVAMAGAVAAVARGGWRQPTLFTTMPAGAPTPAAGGLAQPVAGASLNPASVAALKTMMRQVVTGGTGTGLGTVPGGPVYAKTGTAEFDNTADDTHAWVIGFQGDVAFAVFVENGGESTATAVPIAAAFLKALAAQ